jgi:Xaa-Pro aminopeptidase
MAERNLDAIIVEGPDGLHAANPDYNYFVGGRAILGTVIKKRGEPTTLIYNAWEQNEAEQTGMALISMNHWNRREIAGRFPDPLDAAAELRRLMLAELGITGGRVGVYGTVKAGPFLALARRLERAVPGLELVAEYEKDIITDARLTKDPEELEALRRAGRKTCEVVQAVVDFIKTGREQDGGLVDASGAPMTIGHVKALIDRELMARGMEAHHTIFAQGRDAGLPHAGGEPEQQLMLGQAIVFDIFPREAGGYYHDMTRTFAIGYAPPELQETYDTVMGAFEKAVGELEMGAPCKAYQDMVCQYFEERGHETTATKYPIEEGYIHSLGHGVGLEVHEDPRFPALQDRGDTLRPGMVFTVEPGLYYPSRGLGVRIEDTFYLAEDGTFESLTPFPKDLVIALDR